MWRFVTNALAGAVVLTVAMLFAAIVGMVIWESREISRMETAIYGPR